MSYIESRRGFIKSAAGFAGLVALAPSLIAGENKSFNFKGGAFLPYKHKKVGKLLELEKNGSLMFNYPDENSPCQAVIIDGKMKAYSILCTHKGCPTTYDEKEQVFNCPCHFSRFDAEKNGEMVIGQSTSSLPEIFIRVKDDEIIAYGVNGLIYGRLSNIL